MLSFLCVIWGCLAFSLVPLHLHPLCSAAAKTQLSWKIVKSRQQTTPNLQVLEPLVGGSGGEDIKQPNDLRKERAHI